VLFVQEISAMARFEKQRTGNHDDEDKTYDSKYAPHTHAQLAIGIHSLFLSVEDDRADVAFGPIPATHVFACI
jgi:hypothetical protein